jgi:hypothetical protein
MPVHQRDIERCIDILPQMWKRGARPNVLNRVKDEMSRIWPITAKTEFADKEVTELFKIRYMPLNPARGVDRDQYHASQMTTEPGEEEGTTIKKTVLLERLNPAWMGERFNPKFLRMVRTASILHEMDLCSSWGCPTRRKATVRPSHELSSSLHSEESRYLSF